MDALVVMLERNLWRKHYTTKPSKVNAIPGRNARSCFSIETLPVVGRFDFYKLADVDSFVYILMLSTCYFKTCVLQHTRPDYAETTLCARVKPLVTGTCTCALGCFHAADESKIPTP